MYGPAKRRRTSLRSSSMPVHPIVSITGAGLSSLAARCGMSESRDLASDQHGNHGFPYHRRHLFVRRYPLEGSLGSPAVQRACVFIFRVRNLTNAVYVERPYSGALPDQVLSAARRVLMRSVPRPSGETDKASMRYAHSAAPLAGRRVLFVVRDVVRVRHPDAFRAVSGPCRRRIGLPVWYSFDITGARGMVRRRLARASWIEQALTRDCWLQRRDGPVYLIAGSVARRWRFMPPIFRRRRCIRHSSALSIANGLRGRHGEWDAAAAQP